MLAPCADFDVSQLFRVVLPPSASASQQRVVEALWRALQAWSPHKKRQWLRFVTGAPSLPAVGAEVSARCGACRCLARADTGSPILLRPATRLPSDQTTAHVMVLGACLYVATGAVH